MPNCCNFMRSADQFKALGLKTFEFLELAGVDFEPGNAQQFFHGFHFVLNLGWREPQMEK